MAKYITANPATVTNVLSKVQLDGQLNDEQFIGAVFAALLVGGENVTILPKMLKNHSMKR